MINVRPTSTSFLRENAAFRPKTLSLAKCNKIKAKQKQKKVRKVVGD
jgi:hypothetical protein